MNITEHIDQSGHNAQVNAHLDPDNLDYVDWGITTTFYEAVHYIDAYAVQVEGSCPYNNHKGRGKWIKKKLPASIRADYRTLKDRSQEARYINHHSTLTSATERQRAKDLRNDELERIKQHLKGTRLPIP